MEQDKKKIPEKIEDLKEDLYSQHFTGTVPPRTEFSQPKHTVESSWDTKPLEQLNLDGTPKVSTAASFFKKILVAAVIFFVISSGLALYIFIRGFNIVSSDKIQVSFVGPVSVAAGEQLSFDIVVENNNNTPIINPTLYIDYPDGTKEAADLTQDLAHQKVILEDIIPKSNSRKTVASVLFGEQHSKKEVKVTLEYGVKNSAAVYKKEKIYDISITISPISIVVKHPSESVSNDSIEFNAEVTSNSTVPLHNLLLKAEYPFGLEFKNAVPVTSSDTNVWSIPRLEPVETKTFTIQGILSGEQGDQRIFRFHIGAQDQQNEKQIATNYISTVEAVDIRKPPLGARIVVSDVANPGSLIGGRIEVVNNLPITVVDAEVALKVGGVALDFTSPTSQNGFYRSSDSTLLWNKSTVRSLATMNPGEKAFLEFTVNTLSASKLAAIKNGEISLNVTASGKRINTTDAGQIVSSKLSKSIRIQSAVGLTSRLVYSLGPIKNSGPVPPKVDAKTTYTVIWTITNSTNLLTGATVKATLPQYVKFTGVISPVNEKVVWNPERNEVVWQVGDVPAGASGNPVKEVAFQVEITPSLSQKGSNPIMVNSTVLQATDSFTRQAVTDQLQLLNTSLPTDPQFGRDDGRVTQ